MAALPEIEPLFLQNARGLFALAYLHAGGPSGAQALTHTLLCDLACSPRLWQRASSGTPGLYRCMHSLCLDQYYRRPKRKKKGQRPAPGPRLPFTLTDALRTLMRLPPRCKTPLYLHLALGWGLAEVAAVIGGPATRASRLVAAGLKRAKLTPAQAAAALSPVSPAEGAPEELWASFLVDHESRTFPGQQRLRRFKRAMDRAIPYIALATVAFCVLAYQGVEHGWFNGQPYLSDFALESAMASEGADYPTGPLAVFAPDPDAPQGLVKYQIPDAPQSLTALVRQMVALGGAPEGTSLLSAAWGDSCATTGFSIEPASKSLLLELSSDAAAWFASASPGDQERMLFSMAKTLCSSYPALETLRLQSGGSELTAAGGSTAQSFLPTPPQENRTANAPYRP